MDSTIEELYVFAKKVYEDYLTVDYRMFEISEYRHISIAKNFIVNKEKFIKAAYNICVACNYGKYDTEYMEQVEKTFPQKEITCIADKYYNLED